MQQQQQHQSSSSSTITSSTSTQPTSTSTSTSILHTEPKFVSDKSLPVIIRKMALHADIASKVYRSQKEGNIYGGKWYERLRQLNRIKKISKEHYAKQQQLNSSKGPNSNTGGPRASFSEVNTAPSSPIGSSQHGQSDFTSYI